MKLGSTLNTTAAMMATAGILAIGYPTVAFVISAAHAILWAYVHDLRTDLDRRRAENT